MASTVKTHIPRLPINIDAIFAEFMDMQQRMLDIDPGFPILEEAFSNEKEACKSLLQCSRFMFQKVVDLNYGIQAAQSDNDQLRQQLVNLQRVNDDLSATNARLRLNADNVEKSKSRKEYWKNRSANFEKMCNDLTARVRSPERPSSSPNALSETLLEQVKQAMATTQVQLGDRTEEFTSVVERLSEQYLRTIESLSEELGGYKEKIGQFVPTNRVQGSANKSQRASSVQRRAQLEEINDLLTTNELDRANERWKTIGYQEIEGETWETNFGYLQKILLSQTRGRISSRPLRIANAEKENKRAHDELAKLNETCHRFQIQLHQKQEECEGFMRHIEVLNETIRAQSHEKSPAKSADDVPRLKLQIDDKSAQVERMEAEVTMLKDLLKNVQTPTNSDPSEANEALESERARTSALQEELTRLKNDLPSAREYNNFKQVIASKDREIEILKKEVEEAAATPMLMINGQPAEQADIDELVAQAKDAEASIRQIQSQLESTMQTNDTERKKYREELDRLLTERDALSATTQQAYDTHRLNETKTQEKISDLKSQQRLLKQSLDGAESILANLIANICESYEDWSREMQAYRSRPVTPVPTSQDTRDRALYAKELLNIIISESRYMQKAAVGSPDRNATAAAHGLGSPAKTSNILKLPDTDLPSRIDAEISDVKNVLQDTQLSDMDNRATLQHDIDAVHARIDEQLTKHEPRDLGHWALDRWKEAEAKVVELRNLLLTKQPDSHADQAAEIAKLQATVEKGNNQISSLQNAVNWLQAERQKMVDAKETDEGKSVELREAKDAVAKLEKAMTQQKEEIGRLRDMNSAYQEQLFTKEKEWVHALLQLKSEVVRRLASDGQPTGLDAESVSNAPALEILERLTDELACLNDRLLSDQRQSQDATAQLEATQRAWAAKEDDHKLTHAKLEKKVDLLKDTNAKLKKDIDRLTTHITELDAFNAQLTTSLADEQSKVKGTFEQGKLLGIGEGRSIERSEIQAEIERLEALVYEYKQLTDSRAILEAANAAPNELSDLRTENQALNSQLKDNAAYIHNLLANYEENKDYYTKRDAEYQRLLALKDEEVIRLRYFNQQLQAEVDTTSLRSSRSKQ